MDFKTVLFIIDIAWLTAFVLYALSYFFGVRAVYEWTNDSNAGFWKYYAFISFIAIGVMCGVVVLITLFEAPDAKEPAVYFGLVFQILAVFIAVVAFVIKRLIQIVNWLGNTHDTIIKKRGL